MNKDEPALGIIFNKTRVSILLLVDSAQRLKNQAYLSPFPELYYFLMHISFHVYTNVFRSIVSDQINCLEAYYTRIVNVSQGEMGKINIYNIPHPFF